MIKNYLNEFAIYFPGYEITEVPPGRIIWIVVEMPDEKSFSWAAEKIPMRKHSIGLDRRFTIDEEIWYVGVWEEKKKVYVSRVE